MNSPELAPEQHEGPRQAQIAACPHKRVKIQIYEAQEEVYLFKDGIYIEYDDDSESVTLPHIGVTCQDCPLDEYYPDVTQAPQWVQAYHHRIAHWVNMEEPTEGGEEE